MYLFIPFISFMPLTMSRHVPCMILTGFPDMMDQDKRYLVDRVFCATYCRSDSECQVSTWLNRTCPDWSRRRTDPTKQQETNSIGQQCSTDRACQRLSPETICYREICLCKTGLSLHPNGSCVHGCDEYGDNFTMYIGMSNDGHNTDTQVGLNFGECSLLCLSTTTFTCVSLELGQMLHLGHSCHINKLGFLDVPEEYRRYTDQVKSGIMGRVYYMFGTRNCKGAMVVKQKLTKKETIRFIL